MEGILSLSGGCLDGVWIVSWGSLIGVHKKGQKGVLNMSSKACLKSKRVTPIFLCQQEETSWD